jgi:FkbM family methyltransferase
MKRFLKKRFSRLVPGAMRSSIKRRFSRKFVEFGNTQMSVEEQPSALKCTIDVSGVPRSFLAPLNCKNDLANMTGTSEGRVELESVARAAESGGSLFDIGAHSGLFSAVFCVANTKNRVVSFEPSPILAERLAAIRGLNQFGERMRVEQIGIADENSSVKMLLDPAGGFVQAQRFDHTMWASPEVIDVRMETIERAALRLDLIPQFIKLDIESYEFEAIKGSLEFLSRHKPTIFLELHLNYLEQRKLTAKAVVEMLEQCGYGFHTSGGVRLKPREVFDSPLPNLHVVLR